MGNKGEERFLSSKSIPSGSNLQVEVRKLLACGHSRTDILDWTSQICENFELQRSRGENSSMTRQKTKPTAKKKLASAKKTGLVKTAKKDDSRPTASRKSSKRKICGQGTKVVPQPIDTKEYRLSRWITNTKPQKSPYVPQIGDEVVYCWQGHKAYVEAVRKHKVYEIDHFKPPWSRYNLKTEEPMKIVSVMYKIGPPTTCELKLAFLNPSTRNQTGGSFQLRYHDMKDVDDFLVLAQFYNNGRMRIWKRGDRFRTVLGNNWWFGKIETREPLDAEYPDSLFQCFCIRWDSGDSERMSPWDLEPLVEKNSLTTVGAGNPLTQGENQKLQYKPQKGDWGSSDRDTECCRILKCLNEIMVLSKFKELREPVDLKKYPDYTWTVPYPTNLKAIQKRLELRFYRRRSALEWEVKRIEPNARAYYDEDSWIVKNAKLVTEILLKVISDPGIDNAMTVCNMLADSRGDADGTNADSFSESRAETSDSEGPPILEKVSGEPATPPPRRRSSRRYDDKAWIHQCSELLGMLMQCEDSAPFRQPVDKSEFPDYYEVIENPMDLQTVETKLKARIYPDPTEFAKDIRLIINNSKAYNTKKRSEVYSMTVNLSALFDDAFRDILQDYKNAANMKLSSVKNREQQSLQKRLLTVEQSYETDRQAVNENDIPGPSGVSNRSKSSKPVVQNGLAHNSADSDSDCSVWSGNDDVSSGSSPSPGKDEEEDTDLRGRTTKPRMRKSLSKSKQKKATEAKKTTSSPFKRKLEYHSDQEEYEPASSPPMKVKKRTKMKQPVLSEESDTSEEDEGDASEDEMSDSDEDLFRSW